MDLAVVIPTLNAASPLRDRLAQIAGERVVVTDGGSTDATLSVALAGEAVLALGERGRGAQLARGARLALANLSDDGWLLFLHADTALPRGWRAMVETHARNHPRDAAHFRYGAAGIGPVSALWLRFVIRLREIFWHLPYGDQGLLISASHYRDLGGYADVPLMEDVEIADRLRGRLRRLPGRIRTDASAYARDGLWRRGRRNLSILRAYRRGVPAADLLARYT